MARSAAFCLPGREEAGINGGFAMRKLCRFRWLSVALAVAGGWLSQAADTLQWRPGVSIRFFHNPRWEGWLQEVNWINDRGPNPAYVQVSPRIRYHANPYLDLGLGYSFVDVHSAAPHGDDVWEYQNRLEVEINPRLELKSGWTFTTRNRLEFRWTEDLPDINYRSRHLLEVLYPVKLPRPFKDLFTNAEYFYDWSRMQSAEHRFSPLGVDLALSARVGFRVYYTWRQILILDHWATSHVFWTTLNLKLD